MAHSWTDRTKYSGKTVNWGLRYILEAAEKMLATKKFGSEREHITLYQGSKSSVGVSAGTHSGWDAYDRSTYNNRNRNRVLRLLGVMDHMRTPSEGPWVGHGHGIVCGGAAAPAGNRQVTAYYNRRNGLKSNKADTGYRMEVFPLFVFPEKAVGKPGKRYCKTACHVYEQPTASSKVANLGPVNVGEVLEAIAVVNVGGKYWFITADGKCGYEGNFQRTPTDVVPDPEPGYDLEPLEADWLVTHGPKWGTDGPHGDRLYERNEGYHLFTKETALVDGHRWYITEWGTWYDDEHLVPWEDDLLPRTYSQRALLNNVCADYRTSGMKSFNNSVLPLTNIFEAERVSLVWTCESGDYADGKKINDALDWGGKRYGADGVKDNDASYVLHGGSVPVTTAIHQDPAKRRIEHEGQGVTHGSRNKWFTWTIERDRDTGIETAHYVTHCEFEPKGPNKTKKWNEHRQKQMDAVFSHADALVKDHPTVKAVFVVGDVNGPRTDEKYPGGDGPGRAAKEHGYVEFYDVAQKKINGDASTHARKGGLKKGDQIDRGWCKAVNGGGVEILEFEIVNCYPWTDHNAVAVYFRVEG